MSTYRLYFVSDVHLESVDESRGQKFLAFLSGLNPSSDITHLFLMGDIFDLWIAHHPYFVNKHQAVIEQIQRLLAGGVKVHFFEGNHDLYLKSFWQDQLGVKVYAGPEYFHFHDLALRVEHGDQIDKEDRGYRFLRWFLRTPVLRFLAHHLPDFLVVKIGEASSRTSRKYTSEIKTISRMGAIEKIRAHAQEVFRDRPFDLLLSGHLHSRDDFSFEVDGRPVRSVNLGSWLDRPCAYLVTSADEQRWIDL